MFLKKISFNFIVIQLLLVYNLKSQESKFKEFNFWLNAALFTVK